MDATTILLPAFAFIALLIATHVYFGLHVLARGIIFIDLALAQIAALGASLAFLAGEDAHGIAARLYGLVAALAAALAFALLRRVPDKTAREVVIGSVYVVATALSVLVLSRSVQGMEELKTLLNGSVLWVGWGEIGAVAALYAVVAALHIVFRRRFHTLSFADSEDARARPSLVWEAAFMASFAVVIAVAVNVAGVLLVFAFLIIPAFGASLLAAGFGARLVLGWALALVGGMAGLAVSYTADLPVGATVVSVLGLVPIIAVLVRLANRRHQSIAKL